MHQFELPHDPDVLTPGQDWGGGGGGVTMYQWEGTARTTWPDARTGLAQGQN
jgi:hypothetical protein